MNKLVLIYLIINGINYLLSYTSSAGRMVAATVFWVLRPQTSYLNKGAPYLDKEASYRESEARLFFSLVRAVRGKNLLCPPSLRVPCAMLFFSDMVLRVGGIREGVAHKVEAYRQDADYYHRRVELVAQVRRHHDRAALVEEVTEGRRVKRYAEADVSEVDLGANRAGDGQRHAQHDDGNQVGQQVFYHHAEQVRAEAAGGNVEFLVADDDDQVPDEPRRADPAREAHREDYRLHARVENVGRQYQHYGCRDIVQYVIQFRKDEIQLPHIAPQYAHEYAHRGGYYRDGEADEERRRGARPDTRPEILPDPVCAEPVLRAGGLVAVRHSRDRVIVGAGGVPLARQIRAYYRESQHNHDNKERSHRQPVFHEYADSAAPVGII